MCMRVAGRARTGRQARRPRQAALSECTHRRACRRMVTCTGSSGAVHTISDARDERVAAGYTPQALLRRKSNTHHPRPTPFTGVWLPVHVRGAGQVHPHRPDRQVRPRRPPRPTGARRNIDRRLSADCSGRSARASGASVTHVFMSLCVAQGRPGQGEDRHRQDSGFPRPRGRAPRAPARGEGAAPPSACRQHATSKAATLCCATLRPAACPVYERPQTAVPSLQYVKSSGADRRCDPVPGAGAQPRAGGADQGRGREAALNPRRAAGRAGARARRAQLDVLQRFEEPRALIHFPRDPPLLVCGRLHCN